MPTLKDVIEHMKCGKCEEEFIGYNATSGAIPLAHGQEIIITNLSCPKCGHIAYTLPEVTSLERRITSLEGIIGGRRNH